MAKIVRLPVPLDADENARANAARTRRLFEWAATVLKDLGLAQAMAQATSLEELRGITLNAEDADVSLAIRDALHPATGDRQEHFRGLREEALKQILKNRLADLKRDREKVLRRHAGAKQRDWTDELILNKDGNIIPNLANLILNLRKAPKWEEVLAYDEFNARVVIRKRPPWGYEQPDALWSDHHESLARVWFQTNKVACLPGQGAAPMKSKLYRCFDINGVLLYVGVSLQVIVRGRAWSNRITRVEIETFPTRKAALEAEATAILTEKPLFNKKQPIPKRGPKDRRRDRHKEPNKDRHSPGYMKKYMKIYMRKLRSEATGAARKPRSADRHLEPNRDRHRPGYMAAYMRRRRAAERKGR